MNQHTDLQAENSPSNGVSARRRFLGIGAKALPVVVTVASQPALGVTCFTPSRSLSRNTSLSQKDFYGDCTNAESPGNYKAQQDPTKNGYHWPSSVKPSDSFHQIFVKGGTVGITKFMKKVNGNWVSKTFGEVLNEGTGAGDGNVAFHVIGAYLNILGGNGAKISNKAMTVDKLKVIWSEYASKGRYEPMAGVPSWDGAAIVNYLKTNGIVA